MKRYVSHIFKCSSYEQDQYKTIANRTFINICIAVIRKMSNMIISNFVNNVIFGEHSIAIGIQAAT